MEKNMTVPSTDPWGTPLVTGLQLDLMLLFTNIWAQPIRQFSAYLIFHFSNLYFVSLPTRVLGDSMKNIIQLKLNNIHCSPSSTKAVISLYKVIRMVKHNFPYINPCSPILPWHQHLSSTPISRLNFFISCAGEADACQS